MAIPDYSQLILEIKPYRNFVNEIIMAIPDDCQLIYEIKPYRKFVNEKVMAVQYFCQCLYTYTHTRKYPPGKQKFDELCPITLEPIVLQLSYIPHWKALIFSYKEPELQGVWIPNKVAGPT